MWQINELLKNQEGNVMISHLHKQRKKGGNICGRSMNKARSQEGNAMILHLHKTMGKKIHSID